MITDSCSLTFLSIRITFAIVHSSGKIPVVNTCFVNRVKNFITAGSSIFRNLVERPSYPEILL